MLQLVSTPITGPPASVTDPSPSSIELSTNPQSAFANHSVSMSPEAVLEAFTPTRGSGMRGSSFASLSHAMPNANEGGLLPASASHYFFQDQSSSESTEVSYFSLSNHHCVYLLWFKKNKKKTLLQVVTYFYFSGIPFSINEWSRRR